VICASIAVRNFAYVASSFPTGCHLIGLSEAHSKIASICSSTRRSAAVSFFLAIRAILAGRSAEIWARVDVWYPKIRRAPEGMQVGKLAAGRATIQVNRDFETMPWPTLVE
jgi:hypothetical protein